MTKRAKVKRSGYYDGHYIDSGLPAKEREKLMLESIAEDEKLTDWPEEEEAE